MEEKFYLLVRCFQIELILSKKCQSETVPRIQKASKPFFPKKFFHAQV